MKKTHPQQPMYRDADGVVRFRPNEIVLYLYSCFPVDHNKLVTFAEEDRRQLAQLIGCSVDAYLALPYVSKRAKYHATSAAAALMNEKK